MEEATIEAMFMGVLLQILIPSAPWNIGRLSPTLLFMVNICRKEQLGNRYWLSVEMGQFSTVVNQAQSTVDILWLNHME